MTRPSPTVAVVVLNWQGVELTRLCVTSLLRLRYPNFFAVVVDNGSGSEEQEQLSRSFHGHSRVHLLFLETNRGYAGGNNAGIRFSLDQGAEWVWVLNNDTEVEPDALDRMWGAATLFPRIGVVGPRVVDLEHPGRVHSAGERYSLRWICLPRTLLRYRPGDDKPFPVEGVLGCAMLIVRRCLEDVGLFVEDFFAYYEEVDFCLRARKKGYQIIVAPQAIVRHRGYRGFLSGFDPRSAYFKARNLLLLMQRQGGFGDWVCFLPTYLCLLASSIGLYIGRGRWDVARALLNGARDGVRRVVA